MKLTSARTSSLVIALLLDLFLLALLIGVRITNYFPISTIAIISALLIFGAVSYYTVLIIHRHFFYKKINSIIDDLYTNDAIDKRLLSHKNNNSLAILELAVSSWIANRKNDLEKTKKLELHRKEYIGNVSHELKTPIFNIQGYISTLLDGGINDPSINVNFLQRAEKSVDRMISTIADLEAISQLETGQLVLEYEKFDLIPLIKDVFEAQEIKAKNKKIQLSLKDKSEKSVFVFADKFRIRQVFTNLIVNSINYGKEGGETKIKFSDTGTNILVQISDNGIGMSKEHLPRVFERFYRIDKSRSRDQGGTGLGLAIVKHIIEAHNQHIEVMSTEGAGSIFSFTLKKAVG
ncbi:MAG: sensor histidine kinase [Bacteroidetes bacterium]|nr:sensor histidine kinase [Bacteroidota bacterium]